jgi:hypothetical protein
VFGAMLRLRKDIWNKMKAALALLEIENGIEQYKKIYWFDEPLSANYVGCDKEFSKHVLDRLKDIVHELGMVSDFPEHMGPRDIHRSHTGQKSILNYVTD